MKQEMINSIDKKVKERLCSYDGRKLVWARYVAVKLDLNGIMKIELIANGFYSSLNKDDSRLCYEGMDYIGPMDSYSKEYYPEDLGEYGDKIISMFTQTIGDIKTYLNSPEAKDCFGEKYAKLICTGADKKNYYFE